MSAKSWFIAAVVLIVVAAVVWKHKRALLPSEFWAEKNSEERSSDIATAPTLGELEAKGYSEEEARDILAKIAAGKTVNY